MEELEDQITEIEEAPVEKTGWDAIPIHFRSGKGKVKRGKLVIPEVQEPLGYITVTGDSPETITLEFQTQEEINAEDTDEPVGDVIEQDDATVTPKEEIEDEIVDNPDVMDAEDREEAEAINEQMDAMDRIEDELNVPEEDDEVAGFLIAIDEDIEPQVIIVRAEEGETDSEAIDRVMGDHNGKYKVGSHEEAIEITGHDPLTKKDN